jgi:FSR family fosmidomycin resistance protein-like MFS transporter
MRNETMKYRYVGLLSVGHLVTDINQGAVPALLPFLISEHHLSYAAAAGIVLASNAASTVVQPLFGHAADRFSKPWILPVGLILAGLGLSLTGLVTSYPLIILASMVSGIGIATYHPEAARLVNFASGQQKGTAMSLFGVGGTLGFAIGPPLTTAALLYWGLKGTLTFLVPVSLMAIVITIQIPTLSALEKTANSHKTGSTVETLPDEWAPFALLTITGIGRSILFYGLITFIPLYWINYLNQSKAAGGAALTIMATAGVVGNLLGGKLADRFGNIKIMLVGFSMLIPLLPALIWVRNPHVAMLFLVPIGLALTATYSPMIVTGQAYLPNHIGLSSGVTLGVAVAIGGIAAPLLGKIADHHGIRWALAGVAFLPVLTTGLTLTLPNPKNLLSRTV